MGRKKSSKSIRRQAIVDKTPKRIDYFSTLRIGDLIGKSGEEADHNEGVVIRILKINDDKSILARVEDATNRFNDDEAFGRYKGYEVGAEISLMYYGLNTWVVDHHLGLWRFGLQISQEGEKSFHHYT